MELFTQATALSAGAVLIITELLKYVPIQFTTKYPAWINGILSIIASAIVVHPVLAFVSIAHTLGTALLIAVTAAIAYNQFTSKLKGGSSTYQT